MRTDRFQPQGPVRDPAGSAAPQQAPRDWWRVVREAIPMLGFAGGLAAYAGGYITTNATGAADLRYAAKEQAQFMASVKEQFAAMSARMDQANTDRDGRNKIINDRLDTAVGQLRDKIEELGRDLQSRSTARTEQFNKLGQDVNTLKLKVCVLSGNKVNQCSS